ncbi:MAG: hypothetical protein H7Z42_15020, partial [Roseiflexaceae bacterium]|nr:hypothetical protein [Roseiflexaceae bacterium]
QVPAGRFLAVGAPGNVLFVLIFFGLGYAFGGSWSTLWQFLLAQPPWAWLALLLGVAAGAGGLLLWQKRRFG